MIRRRKRYSIIIMILIQSILPLSLFTIFGRYNNDAIGVVVVDAFSLPLKKSFRNSIPLFSDYVDGDDTVVDNSNSNTNDYSFFDEASIYIRAGSGGQGSSTYKIAKKRADGIPDGGSGGLGGNVVLQLDDSLNTLAGLNKRALRPNAFGGGGGAASSKRVGNSVNVAEYVYSFRAKDGLPGGRMYDNGRAGEDHIIRVPPGTVVNIEVEKMEYMDTLDTTAIDENTNDNSTTHDNNNVDEKNVDEKIVDEKNVEDDDDEEKNVIKEYEILQPELGTLTFDNPSLIVARGGIGGEGTAVLKGRKKNKKKSMTRKGPVGGERHRLRLTLKLVADVALVGVPNAGKSTFLAAVTSAKPRIADYPFTTVVPNLGVWIPPLETTSTSTNTASADAGLVLCDVPGLIEGAADGVGLGHAFLRHVERCRVILHLVDSTSPDPVADYKMVNEELKRYGNSKKLVTMPQVVVVNKIDSWEEDDDDNNNRKEELEKELKDAMGHTRLLWISAKECDGVDPLMLRMASYVQKVKEQDAATTVVTSE